MFDKIGRKLSFASPHLARSFLRQLDSHILKWLKMVAGWSWIELSFCDWPEQRYTQRILALHLTQHWQNPLAVYLSAMLAGRMEWMQITVRPWCVDVASVMPRLEPGALSISISRGPVAFCTASANTEQTTYDKLKDFFQETQDSHVSRNQTKRSRTNILAIMFKLRGGVYSTMSLHHPNQKKKSEKEAFMSNDSQL